MNDLLKNVKWPDNGLDQVLRLVYLFLDQNRESGFAMYSNKTNTEQFWKD